MTEIIDGDAVAAQLRADLTGAVETLETAGVTPRLATVLMNDKQASETYVSMKQQDCEEVGIAAEDVRIDPEASADTLFDTVAELNAREDVHGILVQDPTPDHVPDERVLSAVDPAKDVDGFHPENVGKLVGGTPRFKPCTPHGVQKLLAHQGVDPDGAEVVVVGRSNIVGKPLANLLAQKAAGGNATVTICHSHTDDLAAHTRRADVVVAACGVPELIDGDMLSGDPVVIDVGINRVDADTEKGYELVGDVDYDSAEAAASAITPVPGGVGPMTRAMLLYNTLAAASEQTGVAVALP
ncbi:MULTISPECIES: bifunctional methylenetetrahydrofolate dehydrogenase/methenyltetrahydrofolate cyclohydrolase [Halobacterium]|uniref:Bifunctional protein FolD n=5 Tax=Halobacterium salinarum TaxID=2242 RepID=FOLD_HALSA|nr:MULTISPECIES: bifunctional methylenetetrahydrofolate dehydrogenase/methenyltetrahydrofolate cyclohydrolase [Halobacterium]Q9HPY4.1 RecName: Full=Bifunctional protein FolD; Includes: RecName: Full=Methylenetetrahydrofolate dehydrogenase; Includes: RecName: Full=Methenyltetrahydrofolate cyclohydrolase [Halobacterium salinarum NRC-1]AAG19733.1 methylenetetrahydrofolate dehydrogenase [Halobacterium salinarum NRC-1]MBB6088736.1 methylenetetrahydrofolate dehydrogenase (NADP+)/methenyltetrahydrofola